MRRWPPALRALALWAVCWAALSYAVAPLAKLVTGIAAPLPATLVGGYATMIGVGILLYHSVQEERWRAFIDPVREWLRAAEPQRPGVAAARLAVLVGLPLAVGWHAYASAAAPAEPPLDPPAIHFTLPERYAAVRNPFGRHDDWPAEAVRAGGVLYTRHCAPCHGAAQDGGGPLARAWQPRPANFRDDGTIAQLPDNYLFWRIKEGGPGLPRGTIDYRSAMPVWDGVLTDREIWQIICFEYRASGKRPAVR